MLYYGHDCGYSFNVRAGFNILYRRSATPSHLSHHLLHLTPTTTTMKVLLFALSASTAAAFAPNAFGVRRTFFTSELLVEIQISGLRKFWTALALSIHPGCRRQETWNECNESTAVVNVCFFTTISGVSLSGLFCCTCSSQPLLT